MMTVSKLRLVERKRLPCEPAAGWLGVDSRRRLFAEERACRRASLTQSARSGRREFKGLTRVSGLPGVNCIVVVVSSQSLKLSEFG